MKGGEGGGAGAAAVEAGGAGTGRPEGMANRVQAIWRRSTTTFGIQKRGEGGEVFPRGAGASGALILALEAARCGRRAKTCLGRFILRHSVVAASSALSFSACLPQRRASNCWIVSSLQKYRIRIEGRAIWRLPGSLRSLRS